jgi:hypothetical protein
MQMNVQNISFKIIIQTLLMQILLLFLGVSILDVDVSFMLRGVSGFLVVAFYKFLLCATLFHDKDLSVAFFSQFYSTLVATLQSSRLACCFVCLRPQQPFFHHQLRIVRMWTWTEESGYWARASIQKQAPVLSLWTDN